MTINLKVPDIRELKPRITVMGVGGAGGNAVNNMVSAGMEGVEFIVANTDAQALTSSKAGRVIQMGVQATEGLGAGSQPEIGREAAEEVIDEIRDHLNGAHMVFITAGMGGGTGTGAAPVIARTARELGILTVGVVTKPFHFEGDRRMRYAEAGIIELQKYVDTLLVIPNQNLFRVANEKTTFADAFAMADQVLYSGVACVTDLMVKEGLINLDFADVRSVMREMGKAMMGTGEAAGEKRAATAAEAAIANPLIDDSSMKGAKGLLISITGGKDMTLYEVDEAATRIREEVDKDANIIVGATFDEQLEGIIRVSVVATGIDKAANAQKPDNFQRIRHEMPRAIERQPERNAEAARPAVAHHEQAAAAAVAAALAEPEQVSIDDVMLRTMPQKPSLFVETPVEEPVQQELPPLFMPPRAEPVMQQPRMPRIEDLPMPGQRQLRARQGESFEEDHPEKQRMSLLQRLAAAGLGRRSEPVVEPDFEPAPYYEEAAPHYHQEQQASDYAPRAERGQAGRGRPEPVQYSDEDDQLEIPAFLRRQAN